MNKCRKSCIIPTPVHIDDAMFIGNMKPQNGDNGKNPEISSDSGDAD